MKTNVKEIGFEEFIEQFLADTNDYTKRSTSDYDKELCLDKEMLMQFIKTTQAETWDNLADQHGEQVENRFFKRLSDEIASRGVLDVLRAGLVDHGANFSLAFYQPNTSLNPESKVLYKANTLSVIRQLKYSAKNENSIDMVIFLNGLPIFTIELKNELTGQNLTNAVNQYRTDRDPKESLLHFKRCLVHFAVDTQQVMMTTNLRGLKTHFLPFNKGHNNSAGNPPNTDSYMTSYMWEEIWTKDMVLEIISRFMTLYKEKKQDDKGRTYTVETLIFPRYHQLQTVRNLIADAKVSGVGKNYLIQHSAGSGKSMTIAWLAHHFAELHSLTNMKVFDSVIVITDRRILDKQLRDTVLQFEQTRGSVAIADQGSWQVRDALESGEKIVISTLQKFPIIVEDIEKTKGKKFAVIIDEAHSSQSGENVKSLKQVLRSSLEEAENQDEANTEPDSEDQIVEEMRSRGKLDNVSFFAFTATPKQKTLELFGTEQLNGSYAPFSIYSMKQAIEEKYIVDVLKNYTTYKTYFKLLKKIQDDPRYDKQKAARVLVNYANITDHAIKTKVKIIVDHFWEAIADEIDGQAKAMIVTRSRLHAVKFKLMMDQYLRETNMGIKAMVAFSGTVNDRDSAQEYSEAKMNGFPESNTAGEFNDDDDYKFLIVANKYQTGFDQPLLTAMYVDKKLGGVNAVQTLSRLNRTKSGKEEVFILDFVNGADEIQESFAPYYTTTILSEATDPNILYDLQRDIMEYKLFSEQEITEFCRMFYSNTSVDKLNSFLDEMVKRFEEQIEQDEQEELRNKIRDYVRKYAFIAQLITFEDTRLEKLYVFLRLYRKKLPVIRINLPTEVIENIDMSSYHLRRKGTVRIKLGEDAGVLEPIEGRGRGKPPIDEEELLSIIVDSLNKIYGLTDDEGRALVESIVPKLESNEQLQGVIKHNSKDAAKLKFDEMFGQELVKMFDTNFSLYEKIESNHELRKYIQNKMFEYVHRKFI